MNSNRSRTSIRQATVDDCPLIEQLIRELALFEKLSHEVKMDVGQIRRSLFGDKPEAEVLIAEYDQTPVGFALFFQNYSTFLARKGIYLEDLFVKPDYRSLGVGQKLLSALAEIAVQRNCGRLEWSVLNWNERAIQFYKSLGATPMSDWTVYRLDEAAIARVAKL